jgi:hypothetical protein
VKKIPRNFGELIIGPAVGSGSEENVARPVFSPPFLNPGLGFKAAIVDFFVGEPEIHQLSRPDIDKLLYDEKLLGSNSDDGKPKISSAENEGPPAPGTPKQGTAKPKLTWFHLTANNVSASQNTSAAALANRSW